jgi:hypothetical protein
VEPAFVPFEALVLGKAIQPGGIAIVVRGPLGCLCKKTLPSINCYP